MHASITRGFVLAVPRYAWTVRRTSNTAALSVQGDEDSKTFPKCQWCQPKKKNLIIPPVLDKSAIYAISWIYQLLVAKITAERLSKASLQYDCWTLAKSHLHVDYIQTISQPLGSGDSNREVSEYEEEVCPGSQENQWHPGLH